MWVGGSFLKKLAFCICFLLVGVIMFQSNVQASPDYGKIKGTLAYYAATTRGCDVDKPRNLAKSVTVE